jgi:hypothetical protein
VAGDDGVIDEHDWSLMARNLTLTYDQRLDKAIEAANFVLDGRRAMRAALGDRAHAAGHLARQQRAASPESPPEPVRTDST